MIDGAVQGDPAVLDALRALSPEVDTFAMVPAHTLVRLHQDPEEPMPYVSRSALVTQLPAEAIETLLEHAGPGSGSPLAGIELRQVGGALRRPAPGHGATASIDADFVLFIAGLALDADMGAFMLAHADRVKTALTPWLGAGQYLNFAENAVDTSLSYGDATIARLRAIKDRVDPDGAIHANHAI
jgi:hypothetical protein